MKKTKSKSMVIGVTIFLAASVAIIFSVFYTRSRKPIAVEFPHITFLSFPQGKTLGSGATEQILDDDGLKSIFAYYIDEKGKPLYVKDLGLSVVGFHGTTRPVEADIKLVISTTTDGSGNLEVHPVLDWETAIRTTNLLQVTIKGKVLEISPNYKLTMNPTRPVSPKGYIVSLYYADHISLEQIEATEVSVQAKGTKKLQIQGKLSAANLAKLVKKFDACIFGQYQVEFESKLHSSEDYTLRPPKEPKAYIKYGDANQPLTVIKADEQNVTISFLAKEYRIPYGSWVNVDQWTAIHYKDYPDGSVVLSVIQIPNARLRNSGVSLHFKKPPGPGSAGTTFNAVGRQIIVRDLEGHPLNANRFGIEGSSITAQLDLSTSQEQRELAFVVGNRAKNFNRFAAVDESLDPLIEYDFLPHCPFTNARNSFSCSALASVRARNTHFFILAFNDEFFPSALVVVDSYGHERARLWHPGHIYSVETLDEKIYCWGKLNALSRDSQSITNEAEKVTFHHPVVFCVSMDELLQNTNLVGPLPDRVLSQRVEITSERKFKFVRFDWYYAFDHRTPAFEGFLLQTKPAEMEIVFTTNERWEYRFDPAGKLLDFARLANAPREPWGPLELVPEDATEEFGTWCSLTAKTRQKLERGSEPVH